MAEAYGGINTSSSTATLVLSTSATKANWFTANSAIDANNAAGDYAVQPDYANNQIKLLAPGYYEVTVDAAVKLDSAGLVTFQLRKNTTAISDAKVTAQIATTNTNVSFTRIIKVNEADNPNTNATFTSSSSGFGGASGAPKMLTALDLTLTAASGTPTATVESCNIYVRRLA